jgi:hypothetical protein
MRSILLFLMQVARCGGSVHWVKFAAKCAGLISSHQGQGCAECSSQRAATAPNEWQVSLRRPQRQKSDSESAIDFSEGNGCRLSRAPRFLVHSLRSITTTHSRFCHATHKL